VSSPSTCRGTRPTGATRLAPTPAPAGIVDQVPAGTEVRVSTLELFFDLVFVSTVTQFARLLAAEPNITGAAEVILLFSVTWYAYDSYAWLTNALAHDIAAHRLLLLQGMAGFLVMALAIPSTFDGGGLPFAVAYAFVVLLHSALYIRGTTPSEARAMRAIAPYNLIVATLVLMAAIEGGTAQWVLMVIAATVLWSLGLFVSLDGFRVVASHFAERHELLIIVALGESIVVLGAGAGHHTVGLPTATIAMLGLTLTGCLWWTYFTDEKQIEYALRSANVRQRPELALIVYGYLHFFLLLGIILVASGLKSAIPRPFDGLPTASAIMLGTGTAMFVAADEAMTRLLRIRSESLRSAPVTVASIAAIPIGHILSGAAQIAILIAILAIAIAASPGLRRRSPLTDSNH
jgi:low temperature requirement protein LtrA